MQRFLFLLASTRNLGNSEQLAYCAAHPLPPHIEREWLNLPDYPLPDFVDLRHHTGYQLPTGNARLLLDATLKATDVVLAAPLYMYNLPVPAKQYLDYWSAWLRTPGLNFRKQMKGKTLWAVVVSSGGRHEVQHLEAILQLTAEFMQMRWGGLLYGTGSRPNDIQGDALALKQATTFLITPPAPFDQPPLASLANK